ncbi:hypothetical protein G8764_02620 [Pseudomaricurvus alcaniphilus]|uniref:hypothetical protein n=1 Tax=Pseudomaricurvus alcaniphilus TaxID=1166482 RepID=UPI00140E2DBD|nr:hypothetical protein [Pseudomaricurvus alcaniphilus]NHN36183.1 hypothetical protein [Pseudomaricurvus alcaniphilus]
MKRFCLFLTLAITGCSSIQTKPEQEIVGVWSNPEVNGGQFYYQKVAYTSDGKKCSAGIGIGSTGELEYGFYVSTWKIIGDEIHLKVQSSSSEYVYVGETIIDQIIEVGKDTLQVKMIQPKPAYSEGMESYSREESLQPDQICELALRYSRNK